VQRPEPVWREAIGAVVHDRLDRAAGDGFVPRHAAEGLVPTVIEELHQPFTPPAVNPPTTRSWNTAIRIEIGTIATISAAEIRGQGNAYSPW